MITNLIDGWVFFADLAVPVVVRPLPGALQEDRDGLQAGSQDRGALHFFPSFSSKRRRRPLFGSSLAPRLQTTLDLQVVKNNLNPIWKPFRVPLRSLCGGDVEGQIKATLFKVPRLPVYATPFLPLCPAFSFFFHFPISFINRAPVTH